MLQLRNVLGGNESDADEEDEEVESIPIGFYVGFLAKKKAYARYLDHQLDDEYESPHVVECAEGLGELGRRVIARRVEG